MTATAAIDRRRARRWQPPKSPRPLAEFARTLRLPDGTSVNHLWVPDSEPAQIAFLREFDSGNWRKFVVVAPSQRGKTLKAILCPMLHSIIERRQSVGYVMPNMDKLTQNWETKIKPAISGTGFGKWLPTKGPGSKQGRPAVLTLRDPATTLVAGRLIFMALGGGGKETAVSSVSTSTVMLDEADDAQDVGQIGLVYKRAESFGPSGIAIIASTVNQPKERDNHPVLDARDQGTRSRLHHQCPHCKGHFAPDFEHMNFDDACVICHLCSVRWSESDRAFALNHSILVAHTQKIVDGHLTGTADGNIFSMTTTGLDYHWLLRDPKTGLLESPMPGLCADYRAAKIAESRGDFSLMKLHMNKVWCRHYIQPQPEGELSTKLLADRSSTSNITKRIVPAWVKFLTIAQDPGKGVHYWQVMGHGDGDRWAMIDWGYERTVEWVDGKMKREPNDEDHVHVLNLIRDKANEGWQVEGTDRKMRPVQRGIDIGYKMKLIVAWLAGEPEWKAVRGLGESNYDESKSLRPDGERGKFALAEEISRTNSLIAFRPAGWRQYIYGLVGDAIRHNIHASLLRTPDDHGSGQIPKGLKANDMLILHLCGEVWKPSEIKDGKQIAGYWAHPHGGWDLLDCGRYNIAMSMLHRFHPERYDSGELISEPLPEEPTPEENWIRNTTTTTWKI